MPIPPDLFDFLNSQGASPTGPTEETVVKRTVILEYTPEIPPGFVGGNVTRETARPDGTILIIEEEQLFLTCIGCTVTTDRTDTRFPYFAGHCYRGHPTCSKHLHKCEARRCERLVCPREGVQFRPGRYLCRRHNLVWLVKQALRFIFSPFIRFPESGEGGNHV